MHHRARRPAGTGPWPAVIVFFDAAACGLRRRASATVATGQRLPRCSSRSLPSLASAHRSRGRPVTLRAMQQVFQDPALLEFANGLSARPATVRPGEDHRRGAQADRGIPISVIMGTTGYCMGGNASVRAASIFAGRIAAAIFHPGEPDHRLQPDNRTCASRPCARACTLALRRSRSPHRKRVKLRCWAGCRRGALRIEHYGARNTATPSTMASPTTITHRRRRHHAGAGSALSRELPAPLGAVPTPTGVRRRARRHPGPAVASATRRERDVDPAMRLGWRKDFPLQARRHQTKAAT